MWTWVEPLYQPFADMSVFENVLVGASSGSGLLGQAAYSRAVESLEVTGLTGVANRHDVHG